MPFQPVEDSGQAVSFITLSNAYEAACVFGFKLTVDMTQDLADFVHENIRAAFDEISDFWSDQTTLTHSVVTDLRTEDGPQYTSVEGGDLVGTSGVQPLPNQLAALISWGSDLRGPGGRGRTYIPGFSEAYSNGVFLESALVDSLGDFVTTLNGGHSVYFQPAVISRYLHLEPRDPAISNRFTSGTIHNQWATQRRRAPKV